MALEDVLVALATKMDVTINDRDGCAVAHGKLNDLPYLTIKGYERSEVTEISVTGGEIIISIDDVL